MKPKRNVAADSYTDFQQLCSLFSVSLHHSGSTGCNISADTDQGDADTENTLVQKKCNSGCRKLHVYTLIKRALKEQSGRLRRTEQALRYAKETV